FTQQDSAILRKNCVTETGVHSSLVADSSMERTPERETALPEAAASIGRRLFPLLPAQATIPALVFCRFLHTGQLSRPIARRSRILLPLEGGSPCIRHPERRGSVAASH